MCGLLGLLTAEQDAVERVANVTAALRCQRHRGPDESGTWNDADVVLGFNRLSIIDLEHSHQPLRWGPPEAPQRYTILFNGEIYNYVELREELQREPHGVTFHTEGDTEVIVAAYHHFGPAATAR
ncbi:MAG: asparagine synthase (glutamine-hydrolyzing), partial [Pseudonocardiaceae bacterium]